MPKLYRDATTGHYTTAEDAAARPAETVAETVEARHETPDVAELRRLYEAAMCVGANEMAWDEWTTAISEAADALLDAAAERDALAAKVHAFETDDQKLSIMNGWLVYDVGEHTCGGYGPESGYAHEPGCGFEPVLRLDKLQGWPAAELDALNGQLFDAGYRCGELLAENRALAAKVERVRALPAKHPAGGWYMTSMRDVLAALDEEPQP